MSSQWTSKYAIMRDLSLAQGCDVPADLQTTVAVGERPPAPDIAEETEEEYFEPWLGDGEIPDLSLIQQMLEMVRDTGVSSDNEDEPDKVLQISKPPALIRNDNIQPNIINNNNNTIKTVPKKPKSKRENVAVNSILNALAGDCPIMDEKKQAREPLKLLKPTDFMSTEKEMVESVEKVNDWLNAQKSDSDASIEKVRDWLDSQNLSVDDTDEKVESWLISQDKGKPSNKLLDWEPSTMFKRKSASTLKSAGNGSVKSTSPQKAPVATASYRPSTLADEYYHKYVERSKMKELVEEDVWTRAERTMKEIDAKKKSEVDEIAIIPATEMLLVSKSPMESSEDTKSVETSRFIEAHRDVLGEARIGSVLRLNTSPAFVGPDAIKLPMHRHQLTGACAVCAALAARGIDLAFSRA